MPPASNKAHYLSVITLLATAGVMLVVSWRRWPEVLVDFGLQLYIPWQLTSGSVLYRDIAYLPGGPISQYFNAGAFELFGASLMTLAKVNLGLSVALLTIIFHWFKKSSGLACAFLVSMATILVFMFSQYEMGNYNFIAPYSHEALHGLLLGVLTLAF
ncbi:MAG: hypothetical protein ACK4UN_12350, partial [Limisphaerales bacterium]